MALVKMSRGKAIDLSNLCSQAAQHFGDRDGKIERKLAYACLRNIEHLKPEVEIFQKLMEPFEAARVELLKSCAKKDEAGEAILIVDPQTKQGRYDIAPDAIAELDEKFADLTKEHKIDEFRQEEVEATIHMIDLDTMPAHVRLDVLAVMAPMISSPA